MEDNCIFELKEVKQNQKLLEKDVTTLKIEAAEERVFRRQINEKVNSNHKDIHGNGDPGLRQRCEVLEKELATLRSEVVSLKKVVWWIMSSITAVSGGAVTLSQLGVI